MNSSKLLTLTITVNGEPEVTYLKSLHDVHAYVEAVIFDLEIDGMEVQDETWIKTDSETSFEVELTVTSEEEEELSA